MVLGAAEGGNIHKDSTLCVSRPVSIRGEETRRSGEALSLADVFPDAKKADTGGPIGPGERANGKAMITPEDEVGGVMKVGVRS